jgi:23S rRNA pseudouridine2604 synthase
MSGGSRAGGPGGAGEGAPAGPGAAGARINKYISETGVCSRREADRLIEAGRVSCNGIRAELGTRVKQGDTVCIDGAPIGAKKPPVYLALNKPLGIICTTEPDVPGNIVEFVGHPERIFPIGRLDKDSQGLILLTNDGDIVNEILRAENAHEKEYWVTVNRPITDLALTMLARGVKIMGEMTRPAQVERLDARGFRIILTQGLNRQIRRMCSALGYRVESLKRVRIMNIRLGQLPSGAWRELTAREVAELTSRLAAPRARAPRSTAPRPAGATADPPRGRSPSGRSPRRHRPNRTG